MMPWKSGIAVCAAVAALVIVAVASLVSGQGSSSSLASAATVNPSTGVGSCTLRNWNPSLDPANARNLPKGHRPQTYAPDDFNCIGAVFTKPGVEFSHFPQPHDFRVVRHGSVYNDQTETSQPATQVAHASATVNPLAPYFPPFTHFVIIYRENHTFDDYLGDCTSIYPGCNGQVQSTNHISSVPNLHTLASTYALSDAYSTGTQPPSGPNHWWLFSGQSSSSSQQQSYPTATGTEFDRFLGGTTGPAGEGTNPCTAQTGTGTGSSPYTFVMNGDFYWMLNSGSGFWRNPGTGNPEVLPVNRPGTSIPEELHQNEYACSGQSVSDTTVMNDYKSFVNTNGLPVYSYVELFNDHPGTYQDIPTNDADTSNIVNFLMGNSTYKNNTVIIVTEDDTQNGNNGPDHVSNTYRVPLVVIGSPTYVKAHYLSHVAYTTSNVLAAMERTMENVKSGIIDPSDNLGLKTFPMTTADQAALGDPLEDFWVQGSTPLSATAAGSPTTGNAPLNVSFTGSAAGGTAPYSYSWNFGDGSATSTAQNPSHTYNNAGTYTATLTVTDSASPAHTATATVTVTVNAVGNPLTATAAANPTSGQVPLNVAFTGTGTGGTPPYSYSWNFGDGSATSTAQNPSHTYNNAGTYTATLTVTDSASPAHTANSTVSITASPIAGTAPGAPTGLTATGGTNQVSLSWTAPSNNGGVNITSYRVYRGTTSGSETLLSSGGCSGLGNVTSCTDTGLTAGQAYFYKVSAVNAIGEGAQSNEASATPTASNCTSAQLLGNPGFETGTASPWSATSGVINNNSAEPPHTGSWDAWLDGYGTTHTDTLSQSVTIPSGCNSDSLSFWLHIDTADTGSTAQDTLQVQILNSSGTVLSTLHTYSNLDAASGYQQRTFDLSQYAGQAITLKLTGTEDASGQTSFVADDFALNVAGGSGGANTVTVTNPGSQTGTVGTATSLQIQASDSASGQTLTYSATGLPAGLSINSSSGLISGTPTSAGTANVTVTAKDTTGASGSTSFTWTINPAANTVTVTNPGSQTGTVGTPASLQIQASDSASGQTLTYSATGLPAGLSINSSSGLISGTPTSAGTANVTVTAKDTTGASGSTSFTWTINSSGGCTAAQLLGNPGFETGTASPWSATSGVISNSSSEPPHSGSWDAWLDGYGTTHTDTLSQKVTIPMSCMTATLSFWLHIDTAETTTTTAYDTLKVQILNSSGTVLSTLHTYSNLDHATGYLQHSFAMTPYIGQTITLKFTGTEDYERQTSFVIDDTAINVN